MTFFNRKEEVIDIELTQYGKLLLAKGKFKPKKYAFFDDDVIYDAQYATPTDATSVSNSIAENQNDVSTRIKESVRSKAQYNYGSLYSLSVIEESDQNILISKGTTTRTGIDIKYDDQGKWIVITAVFLGKKAKDNLKKKLDWIDEQHNVADIRVEDFKIDGEVVQYGLVLTWKILSLNDKDMKARSLTLNFTSNLDSGATVGDFNNKWYEFGNLPIPQLHSDIEIRTLLDDNSTINLQEEDIIEEQKLINGLTLRVKNGYLLLMIDEENTYFENENFSIEEVSWFPVNRFSLPTPYASIASL